MRVEHRAASVQRAGMKDLLYVVHTTSSGITWDSVCILQFVGHMTSSSQLLNNLSEYVFLGGKWGVKKMHPKHNGAGLCSDVITHSLLVSLWTSCTVMFVHLCFSMSS